MYLPDLPFLRIPLLPMTDGAMAVTVNMVATITVKTDTVQASCLSTSGRSARVWTSIPGVTDET